MTDSSPYCFISYSRRDTAVARWLQRKLESYEYPAALVKPGLRPEDPARLRPVFLDTSDLPTLPGRFWDDLCTKIDSSKYLLVIGSRAAAASEYVDKEIARFIGDDEGRLDRIILVIVDPNILLSSPTPEDFPPQILQRWSYFSARNHPLMLPEEGDFMSSVRERGLMQIISFMLGIDWTALYNRHLIARRKVLLWTAALSLAILAAISVSLGWALWKERELTVFERDIFPYSVVVAYVDNFLSPLITALETEKSKPLIIIALPASYNELDHNARVGYYKSCATKAGYTAEFRKVTTKLPRGAETAIIIPTPPYYRDKHIEVYIDFASTVASFRHVIEYKKKNAAYAQTSQNQMLIDYAAAFERSVMAELKKHDHPPERVVFVRSPERALQVLAGEK